MGNFHHSPKINLKTADEKDFTNLVNEQYAQVVADGSAQGFVQGASPKAIINFTMSILMDAVTNFIDQCWDQEKVSLIGL